MTTNDKSESSPESRRLALLKQLEILDTPATPEFDRITQLAADLLGAPISQLSLIDERRQWVKSCVGLPRSEVPREFAFCGHTIQRSEPLLVSDATEDPVFSANPFVTGEPHVRFYAGTSLVDEGAAVGSLCVVGFEPRTLSRREVYLLRQLGELAVDQLQAHARNIQLARLEERFRLAALASSDAVYEWDLRTDAVVWSVGLDYNGADGNISFGDSGEAWKTGIHPDDRARTADSIERAIRGGDQSWSGLYRYRREDGSYAIITDRVFILRSPSGEPRSAIGAMHNVTQQKEAEAKLHRAAYHDSLTGLPNRALFLQSMEEALRTAEKSGGTIGVIYIDLDDFKDVNDTLGHDAGDAVLAGAAARIADAVPPSALVARLGGDEFAVLIEDNPDRQVIEQIARDVLGALEANLRYEESELSTKASLGLAHFPESDARPSELLKIADMALYKAKRAGGNQYAFFTPQMRNDLQQKVSALSCARDALLRDAIVPFYQPKVYLETGRLYGFEALLRWVHPRTGIQPPGLIKEAFDDPVLAVEIGRRMMHKVLQDLQAWRAAGLDVGSVAINVSGPQFLRTDFANELLGAIDAANLPLNCIEVEVTETVFLSDGSDAVGRALRRLHSSGVSIALDDFGTGYASLTHLNEFPVSWIKIDRSFVRELHSSPDSAAIAKAIIGLAHNLGVQVVAEGVETAGQWESLRGKGCDLAQGFLIAKPMSGSRVPHFTREFGRRGAIQLVSPRSAC